jgi:hypothetical protein
MWASEGARIPPQREQVRGALLLYHFPSAFWFRDAATIMDHVNAFGRYSRFDIQKLNTDEPLPQSVAELDFELVIVHYSVIGTSSYPMTEDHFEWLRTSRAYKVMFAQDEFRYCGHRFWFMDEVGINTMYTCLEPPEFEKVYGSHTQVERIRTNLPGYVSDQMVADGERLRTPDEQRPVDIGYRGRPLPPYCGRGGVEKYEIGVRFAELAEGSGLTLDIGLEEEDRIYGEDWPRFLSRCRGVLGVESGVSVFDLDDRLVDQYETLVEEGRSVTLDDLTEAVPLEDQVFYRTISPRHFEAAAQRCCQILFEGHYSGVMEPMVHYIPLRKDFSNFDEVIERFRDQDLRRRIAENAHRDLIASGRYTYRRFIEDFDRDLIEVGLVPDVPPADAARTKRALNHGRRWRKLRVQLRWLGETPAISFVLARLFMVTGAVKRRLRRG